jgi:hypothetical protein
MADNPWNELRSKAHWQSRRVRLLTEIKRMKKNQIEGWTIG